MITIKFQFQFGNYTSQYYANIYMTNFDKYITQKLGIKWYVRYMDDFVLILESKEKAKQLKEKIAKYLKENLELELNKKTAYFKVVNIYDVRSKCVMYSHRNEYVMAYSKNIFIKNIAKDFFI